MSAHSIEVTAGMLYEAVAQALAPMRGDEWVGTEARFRIQPLGQGRTRLTFEHLGLVPGFECWDICQDGWRHFLASLKMLLESGRGTPYELEEAAHG